ncbi:NAD(P)-dependent alcohol dehydrogenase [Hoyosella altamirensis]|uniref:Aryl-alcohol dehydrogenase n=1 Tax=Hoyosella altamirensis TaxID=616997 RepID=A0A839RPN8_9ACTN|nr:NAD(P)-dependent alcohol dehydrogenase [Hoyosella altamirensis]MBB3038279.1 aryl-alcohol dehydrogenase [Hoyosella altamirensis]
MKTLAAVSPAPDAPFVIQPVELAAPRADEILVRVEASGVCHTDLTFKSRVPTPAVFGHEGAGVVESVGVAVEGIHPGDRVLLSYRWCGECRHCKSELPSYCTHMQALNSAGGRRDGTPTLTQDGKPLFGAFFGQSSFAQHVLTSSSNVVVVDDDVADLATAAPLGCGFQTGAGAVLNVLAPGADSSLVIFGAGAVGLAAIMAARARGVRTVVAIDPVESRRHQAIKLGATVALEPGTAMVGAIREVTDGGASHALDTTGIPAVVAEALTALDSCGTLVVVGLGKPMAEINITDLMLNGKTLRGCTEGDGVPQDFIPTLLDAHAEGRFPMEQLVTKYSFHAINEAVADMRAGSTIKPVLVWEEKN